MMIMVIKSQGITKVIRIHALGNMTVSATFCADPTYIWDNSLNKWHFYLLVALEEKSDITKVITIHVEWDMNVFTKFHGKPSNRSPDSVCCIFLGPWMSVKDIAAVHQIVVEVFHSGWWTNQHTNITMPRATLPPWLKTWQHCVLQTNFLKWFKSS